MQLKQRKASFAGICYFCNSVIEKGQNVYDLGGQREDRIFCQKCGETTDEKTLLDYKRPNIPTIDEKQKPLASNK